MTRRRKPDKKQGRASLSLKQWKSTAIAAMAVALTLLAVLITVLTTGVPGDSAAPGGRVLAVVNDEEITVSDVTTMQSMILQEHGREVAREEALERAIGELLMYREAERGNYAPTMEQTEQLVLQRIAASGVTREVLGQQLHQKGLSWEDYLTYYQRLLAVERYLDSVIEVPEPTEQQLREFYDEYIRLFPDDDRPFEEMEEDLRRSVEWLNRERVTYEHIAELRRRADIEYR